MERTTRFRFNEFTQQIGTLNGVSQAEVTTSYFTVEPSIQQKLVTRMQESTAFLGKINILPVTQMKGQVLGLTVGSSIGRNVDTSGGTRRTGIDPTGMNAFQYNCNKNNFDTALKYAKLDSWALFPDFEVRIRNVIVIRQGLDRICVGFNGTSYALTSNITANPLLQDFNRGWLQAIREDAPQRVLDEVADGKVAGKVTYGAYGDYENLDALVWDAKEELLPIWAREDPDLVVIVGSKLLHDKYFPLINRSEGSLDMMARQVIMTDKQLGGLPVFRVPYFPDDAILITKFSNLSIYYQTGGQRRWIQDEPWLDQVTDYQSSNDAYVVEDYDYVALVENITAQNTAPDTGTGTDTGTTGTGG
jgi:P2 family phage major capsid protein